ncbi:unnamed protein product [Owenia fusiformis]|uniref:Uncharacterized protein n=1 Tax=Owenia fusiformis TaxID=6347 RepID=A0A8J1Y1Q2_OWEFU|nr:unnamed protein product [Owenia fusiformis]
MTIAGFVLIGFLSVSTSTGKTCEPTREDVLGPFYKPDTSKNDHICMRYENYTNLPKTSLTGYVRNENCNPLYDVKIEIWQTDDHGDYHRDDTCRGFVVSDTDGFFKFETIHPGRYLNGRQFRPSHIHLYITKSGYHSLVTQIYFEGDPYLGENDGCPPPYCGSDDPKRIVGLEEAGSTMKGSFDIILSGSRDTINVQNDKREKKDKETAGHCDYNDKTKRNGTTFKHADKCNKCECLNGIVKCSNKKRCSGCKYEGTRHKNGEYFFSSDKCKKCICISGSKKAKCEEIQCEPTTCTYGDRQYKKGKQWLADDKCNKCKCRLTGSGLESVCSDSRLCRMCIYKGDRYKVGDVFQETDCRRCECHIKNNTVCNITCDYCSSNGRQYRTGEKWRHADRCNECRCKEGLVICSDLAKCKTCLVGGITYKSGEDFLLDGCVECKCVASNRLDCSSRCEGPPPANATCGVRPDVGQSRITGGTVVHPEFSWPWMVTIRNRNIEVGKLRHVCGAAIVNRNWVVTAAHCFSNKKAGRDPDDFVLFFGKHHRINFEPGQMSRDVELIIIHEEFDKASQYDSDIALMKFKEPLNYTERVQPLCVAKTNATFCVMIGWGSTARGDITKDIFFRVELADLLHQVIVPLIDTSICNRRDWLAGRISENMLCAGFEEGGKDACMGDSGGPMFCADNLNQWTLKGIASWGIGCGVAKRPGVYTKVENFLDWIDEKIEIHG